MEKFTQELRGLLFPVVTVWVVTGWDAIWILWRRHRHLRVDFSIIQEDL